MDLYCGLIQIYDQIHTRPLFETEWNGRLVVYCRISMYSEEKTQWQSPLYH